MGLTHFYYGYGKGKTTAALGLALRALGQGLRVVIVQFLKPLESGEQKPLESFKRLTFIRPDGSGRFAFEMDEEERLETKKALDESLARALALARGGECDMLILDEAADAYARGLLDSGLFEETVKNKPQQTELVITGHEPLDFILDNADYVTEMVKIKHPYELGVESRQGIEF